MSLMPMLVGGDVADETVVIPDLAGSVFWNRDENPTVYSGVKFSSDGQVYARQLRGGWTNVGTWLHKGAAATFYLSRTTDDVLTTDAGAGWLVMSSDRIYDMQRTSPTGISKASVTFEISNDSGGTPVVAGPQVYNFVAETGLL